VDESEVLNLLICLPFFALGKCIEETSVRYWGKNNLPTKIKWSVRKEGQGNERLPSH
jgi:hypothetical protein